MPRFLNSPAVHKQISDSHSNVAEGSNFLQCYEHQWVDSYKHFKLFAVPSYLGSNNQRSQSSWTA
jgi:hypothetical protein